MDSAESKVRMESSSELLEDHVLSELSSSEMSSSESLGSGGNGKFAKHGGNSKGL